MSDQTNSSAATQLAAAMNPEGLNHHTGPRDQEPTEEHWISVEGGGAESEEVQLREGQEADHTHTHHHQGQEQEVLLCATEELHEPDQWKKEEEQSEDEEELVEEIKEVQQEVKEELREEEEKREVEEEQSQEEQNREAEEGLQSEEVEEKSEEEQLIEVKDEEEEQDLDQREEEETNQGGQEDKPDYQEESQIRNELPDQQEAEQSYKEVEEEAQQEQEELKTEEVADSKKFACQEEEEVKEKQLTEEDISHTPGNRTKATTISNGHSKYLRNLKKSEPIRNNNNNNHSNHNSEKLNLLKNRFEKPNGENGQDIENCGSEQGKGIMADTTKTSRFGGNVEKCEKCNRTVYAMEKLEVAGRLMHKTCFRCCKCNSQLNVGRFSVGGGDLYCLTHYKQAFREKGTYDVFTPDNPVKGKWQNKATAAE